MRWNGEKRNNGYRIWFTIFLVKGYDQTIQKNICDIYFHSLLDLNYKELEYLGDEWSDAESLNEVLEDFLFPYLEKASVVAEVGSGGGRLASRVAGRVQALHCYGTQQ